jgi:hypothetical protein
MEAISFISTRQLKKYLFYWDEMKDLARIPGDIVEFGIFRGDTFAFLCHISELLDYPESARRLIGFDTFSGFPDAVDMSISPVTRDREASSWFSNTSKEIVIRKLRQRDQSRITLIEGDILLTLSDHLQRWPNKICMALVDVDTARAARYILEQVWTRIAPGGRIYLDEYSYRGWSETVGVDEFLTSQNIPLEAIKRLPGLTSPTAYIQR